MHISRRNVVQEGATSIVLASHDLHGDANKLSLEKEVDISKRDEKQHSLHPRDSHATMPDTDPVATGKAHTNHDLSFRKKAFSKVHQAPTWPSDPMAVGLNPLESSLHHGDTIHSVTSAQQALSHGLTLQLWTRG